MILQKNFWVLSGNRKIYYLFTNFEEIVVNNDISITQYKNTRGILIETSNKQPITNVIESSMFSRLSDCGFILYRGFDTNIDLFSDFVQSGSSRVTIDPMREFYGNTAQKVDAGLDAVGMHVEHGNNPFQPDICWFYCEKAASSGSQTTVCDGYDVWEKMPDNLKNLFDTKEIMYCRYIEGDKWKKMAKNLVPSANSEEEVTLDAFLSLVDNNGFRVELQEDESVYYEYSTSAVRSNKNVNKKSFANSILGPSYNYQAPIIKFSDGMPIEEDVHDALESIFEESTVEIDWQSGDVLVIDNIHIMHGRRAIEDVDRKLFNAMSFR